MTDKQPRRPAAFAVSTDDAEDRRASASAKTQTPRRAPRALATRKAVAVPAQIDVFEEQAAAEALEPPVPAPKIRRGFGLGSLFLAAVGFLISAAFGLWADNLVRSLFSRNDWLGWAALGALAVAALALAAIVVREWLALRRLAAVESIRSLAADAIAFNDPRKARTAVSELVARLAATPATARGREAMARTKDEIIDGADLVRLAETEILAPIDREARAMVLGAAKRVSIVTAVSPRALVDVGYVMFESARLVRKLAELYGGKPGTLGFIRLARNVIAHLAVTGSIAVGDSLIQQLVGHGIAARLSARLGEGVINGLMTARIGISAMDLVRPFAFAAVKRPGMSDFISDLVRFQQAQEDKRKTASEREKSWR